MTKEQNIEIDEHNPALEKEDKSNQVYDGVSFSPKDVDVATHNYSLHAILEKIKNSEINLFPNYQRKIAWNEIQQSRLIESILIRIPIPIFFFDATNPDKWIVIDGLQRLNSFKIFSIDSKLKLKGLAFLTNLEGKNYDELPQALKRQFLESIITAYLIKPGTPSPVIYNIFERINTTGVRLTPQEIRQVTHSGQAADYITKLAESNSFKSVTQNKIETSRMEDKELVTRFVAFYLSNYKEYLPSLDKFLNDSMSKLYNLKATTLKEIFEDFEKAMNMAESIFGKYAFQKWFYSKDSPNPINKCLFEVWSVILAKLTDKNRQILLEKENKKILINSFRKLNRIDNEFIESITNSVGDKKRVAYRFEKINNLVQEIIKK